jgi:hypothetical protein
VSPSPQANDQAAVERLCAAGHGLSGTYTRGNTIVHWALGTRSSCGAELLEFLRLAGAPVSAANEEGATPLRIAIRNGKMALANKLISMGERLTLPNGEELHHE